MSVEDVDWDCRVDTDGDRGRWPRRAVRWSGPAALRARAGRLRAGEPRELSLRQRVVVMATSAIVLLAIVGGTAVSALHSLAGPDRTRWRSASDAQTAYMAVYTDLVDQETSVRGYLLSGQHAFLEPFERSQRQLPADLARLRTDALTGAGTGPASRAAVAGFQDALAHVLDAHDAWLSGSVQRELDAAAVGDLGTARAVESSGTGKALFDHLRSMLEVLHQHVAQIKTDAQERMDHGTRQLTAALVVSVLLSIVLVLVLVLTVWRGLLNPVSRLAAEVRGAGIEAHATPVFLEGPRELAALARDVEGLRQRIIAETSRANRATEAVGQRAPAVRALQQALAAGDIDVDGFEVFGLLRPAAGDLAGDWWDRIALPDGRLAVVVGDVSGHGPEAGVFALQVKRLLTAALRAGHRPAEALRAAAHGLGDEFEQFATVFVAVMDTAGAGMEYANAGHPPAVLLGPGGSATWLDPTGPLLSSVTAGWRNEVVPVAAGARLFVYTDGLTEQRRGLEQFGDHRLRDELADLRDVPADQFVSRMLAAVSSFSDRPAADDCTLLVVDRARTGHDDRSQSASGPSVDDVKRVFPGAVPQLPAIRTILPREVSAAGQARAELRLAFTTWQLPAGALDDAELVVSELVANASRHGAGLPVLTLSPLRTGVRIEVWDASSAIPQPKPLAPELDDFLEGGRGLSIIAVISSDWGWQLEATGKRVWAEVLAPTA